MQSNKNCNEQAIDFARRSTLAAIALCDLLLGNLKSGIGIQNTFQLHRFHICVGEPQS